MALNYYADLTPEGTNAFCQGIRNEIARLQGEIDRVKEEIGKAAGAEKPGLERLLARLTTHQEELTKEMDQVCGGGAPS